ncbi:MAG: histidine phosphatase family protein [Bacteroidetes bacterium]|jgi:phosphohistidine phosphatase|nr:histidine phosphatase family protein [Bacteroidota bacterium]
MKKLFIIRHAKSSWDIGVLNDFDRTLNERGHKNAPEMAKRLLDKNVAIDAFISSPANRAFTTASYFAKAYNKTEKDIIQVPKLYHADVDVFFETIESIDDSLNSVALFSHNPGITEFINMLTKTQIDDMPTCGVFAVEINTTSWKNFKKANKKFMFFDYPKAG